MRVSKGSADSGAKVIRVGNTELRGTTLLVNGKRVDLPPGGGEVIAQLIRTTQIAKDFPRHATGTPDDDSFHLVRTRILLGQIGVKLADAGSDLDVRRIVDTFALVTLSARDHETPPPSVDPASDAFTDGLSAAFQAAAQQAVFDANAAGVAVAGAASKRIRRID